MAEAKVAPKAPVVEAAQEPAPPVVIPANEKRNVKNITSGPINTHYETIEAGEEGVAAYYDVLNWPDKLEVL